MNTQQAYITGFVKRANEYGFNRNEAVELFEKVAFGSPSYQAAQQAYAAQPSPFQYSKPMGVSGHALASATRGFSQTPAGQFPAAAAPSPYQGSFAQKLISGNPFERGGATPTATPAPVAQSRAQNFLNRNNYSPSQSAAPTPAPVAQAAPPTQPQAATSPAASSAIMRMAAPASQPAQTPANPSLMTASAPANPFSGSTHLGIGGASPQPASQPAPTPSPAAAPQQQGPSNAYLAKMMGSYDPNSRMDRQKADAIRAAYKPGMTANQIYSNPAYLAASRGGAGGGTLAQR